MMKRIMVLGAGASQVPLICAAKRLGYYTVVASVPGNYPGFSLGDACCYTDISETDEILRQAENYQIDGMITCGMDTGIEALGKTCDALSLPGISWEAARRANNKALSGRAFREHKVDSAASILISSASDLRKVLRDSSFPAVLKAVDLMGSCGVYCCENEKELWEAYQCIQSESRTPYCLLEEFIDGVWFGAEGMVTEGKLDFLLPYGTDPYREGAAPISLGHWVPADISGYEEQIRRAVKAALTALGIFTAPFDCDLMLKGGSVYVIEINARAGATGLAELVSAYYDIDYYEILCRQAMGESVRHYFELGGRKPPAVLSRVLISRQEGILKNLSVNVKRDPRLVTLEFAVEKGDPVKKFRKARDRLGFAVVKEASLERCCIYMEEILNSIDIEIV